MTAAVRLAGNVRQSAVIFRVVLLNEAPRTQGPRPQASPSHPPRLKLAELVCAWLPGLGWFRCTVSQPPGLSEMVLVTVTETFGCISCCPSTCEAGGHLLILFGLKSMSHNQAQRHGGRKVCSAPGGPAGLLGGCR